MVKMPSVLSLFGRLVLLGVVLPQVVGAQGMDGDMNDCYYGYGLAWCPETESCVDPWASTCPIEGGVPIDGPEQLGCTVGRCSFEGNCTLTIGLNGTDGFPIENPLYLDMLDGIYNIASPGCTATCVGCMATAAATIPGSDDNGCLTSLGHVWCPETSECIDPWVAGCPLVGGNRIRGPAQVQCDSGARCMLDGDCQLTTGMSGANDSSYIIGSLYEANLEGIYNIITSCNATCLNCTETRVTTIPGLDQNGCSVPSGEVWCPEISECIRPWEAACPIAGGISVDAPAQINCTGGRCSLYGDCGPTIGIGTNGSDYIIPDLYMDPMDGVFNFITSNCTVDCMNCTATGATEIPGLDENGCRLAHGELWCPETSQCIFPGYGGVGCPVAGGNTFVGPADFSCSDGRCSFDDDNCELMTGGVNGSDYMFTLKYLDGMNGEYSIMTANCTATCINCTNTAEDAVGDPGIGAVVEDPVVAPTTPGQIAVSPSPAPVGDNNANKTNQNDFCDIAGLAWCPEMSECIDASAAKCPIAGGTSISGDRMNCTAGGRCNLDEGCQLLHAGTWENVEGLLYADGLNGIYAILTPNCTATCVGCYSSASAATTAAQQETTATAGTPHFITKEHVSSMAAPGEPEPAIVFLQEEESTPNSGLRASASDDNSAAPPRVTTYAASVFLMVMAGCFLPL